MLKAAAERGWLNEKEAALEALMCFRRWVTGLCYGCFRGWECLNVGFAWVDRHQGG
jgi:hypothetical protein